MGKATGIAWTDHTFNPWWGCDRVPALPGSPGSGCDRCYAAVWAARWMKWGASQPPRTFSRGHWRAPLAWDREAAKAGIQARVFCASMGDIAEIRDGEHADTLDEQRAMLWPLIESTPNLVWQLLTKRPENLRRVVPATWQDRFPPNVWAGTSVCSQADADARIGHLLGIPAVVRFLSCEPLLGLPVIAKAAGDPPGRGLAVSDGWGRVSPGDPPGIHWLIVGGESGPGARPMQIEWARSLRDQARDAGAAFFMKQLGGRDDKQEDMASFPPDLQVREFPAPRAENPAPRSEDSAPRAGLG